MCAHSVRLKNVPGAGLRKARLRVRKSPDQISESARSGHGPEDGANGQDQSQIGGKESRISYWNLSTGFSQVVHNDVSQMEEAAAKAAVTAAIFLHLFLRASLTGLAGGVPQTLCQ